MSTNLQTPAPKPASQAVTKTNKVRPIEPLSEAMQRFRDAPPSNGDSHISVREIIDFFADRGIGALLFVFGAPMCIPLPMLPGVSVIFSLPLLVLAGLQMAGITKPWLPKALAQKKIERTFVNKALGYAIPWLQKIEKFAKPRLKWMMTDLGYRWSGVVIAIMAVSIMFPLPFSNFGPAIAIVVMAVGRVMHDGMMILMGALAGLIYVFVLYYASISVVTSLFNQVLSLFGFGS